MDDSASPVQQQARPPRRLQPIVSCLTCKRMKLKCDRRLPCERCVHNGRADACAYAPGQEPSTDNANNANAKKRRRAEAASSTSGSEVTSAEFDDLQARVRHLEKALQAQQGHSSQAVQVQTIQPTTVEDLQSFGSPPPRSEGLTDGISAPPMGCHPVVTQFEAVQSFINTLASSQERSELEELASDLRSLHDTIGRTQRSPQSTFLLYDNVQDVLAHMERLLPASNTCTTLIQLYFHNFENCTRVLHRGTAWTQFRAYLNSSLIPGARNVCLPLLVAVISIASSLGTLPECDNSRLHGQDDGIGAYQLLRNYLQLITKKQWRELNTIQLAVLTLKYQKSCPLSETASWQWSGHVLRQAMAAGLHNTTMNQNIFEVEMKKKLWLSILELDLTFAIASGMPANCPKWQYDPLLNVNDGMLWPGITERPQSRPVEEWTDGTCQHVLAQSFNDRLAAYRLVSFGTITPYNTVLEHTRHLEHVIHDLPHIFRLVSVAEDASDSPPHRLFAKMELDFLLRRPLNACYAPYASEMRSDDRYKEARIMWIQGTSFSMCFQDLFDPKYPSLDLPQPEGLWDYFYNVYGCDVRGFLLANCLELQRLRAMHADTPDVVSPAYQGHTRRTSFKVAGWNISGITKSLEDMIDPLARRVGRPGSSLREVVKWTAVIGSLRVNPSCSREHALKNELQGLVSFLRGRTLAHGQHRKASMQHLGVIQSRLSDTKWLQNYLEEAEDDEELGTQ